MVTSFFLVVDSSNLSFFYYFFFLFFRSFCKMMNKYAMNFAWHKKKTIREKCGRLCYCHFSFISFLFLCTFDYFLVSLLKQATANNNLITWQLSQWLKQTYTRQTQCISFPFILQMKLIVVFKTTV